MPFRYSRMIQSLSWRAALRGAFAWLAVLLLVVGLGATRVGASIQSVDASYDDLTLIAQSDVSSGDCALAAFGDDDPGDDDPVFTVALHAPPAFGLPLFFEGQLAFGQRHSAARRALKPTGPPADLTI